TAWGAGGCRRTEDVRAVRWWRLSNSSNGDPLFLGVACAGSLGVRRRGPGSGQHRPAQAVRMDAVDGDLGDSAEQFVRGGNVHRLHIGTAADEPPRVSTAPFEQNGQGPAASRLIERGLLPAQQL